jgi:Predicted ATPases of PP-loop superfamily
MEVCSLFSGGKDSTFALHVSILHGFRVKCLITVLPKRRDSWMFQSQNVDFTSYQADAMGLPLVRVESSGEKERELEDLREAFKIAKSMGAKGIVSGALLSDYQRININSVAHDVGLKTFSPCGEKIKSVI